MGRTLGEYDPACPCVLAPRCGDAISSNPALAIACDVHAGYRLDRSATCNNGGGLGC